MTDVEQTTGDANGRRRLVRVTLERFKAAFRPDPIVLPPFTVLIGRNGTGKSTLLEALQWIDTTLRHDARTACERYQGVHDLLNLRSRAEQPYFALTLEWTIGEDAASNWTYELRVEEDLKGLTPRVAQESLFAADPHARYRKKYWIRTNQETSGSRTLFPEDPARRTLFEEPDRLCLTRGTRASKTSEQSPMEFLQDFWRRAVFLRLSPNRLTLGSPARRRSFDPLLDEEGQNLPALLTELDDTQRGELVRQINTVLRDIKGVELAGNTERADDTSTTSCWKMPYRGRTGRYVPDSV